MLHMQHAQLALMLMERPSEPKIQFPSEDREHQRQLERVRDSLLRRPDPSTAGPRAPDVSHATARAVADLASAAAAGDEERVARRSSPASTRCCAPIVRGYRLDAADADDVVQTTWIRAYGNLDRLNEPAAIGGWLAITARREALRTLQRGVREIVAEEPRPAERDDGGTPETMPLERERQRRAAGGRRPAPRPPAAPARRHARPPRRVLRRDLGARWTCRSARSARRASVRSAACAAIAP